MDINDTADPKRPAAILHHQVKLIDWLPEGATLASAVGVMVEPSGELVVDQCSAAGGFINYRVRAGVAEQDYVVTFAFTTADGLWADSCSIRYPVR